MADVEKALRTMAQTLAEIRDLLEAILDRLPEPDPKDDVAVG